MRLGIDAKRISKGGFLPPARYVSPEFAALEAERLWPRVWHLVCREADLPGVGDWISHTVLGESVLLVRQKSGAIAGFHNVCPHRGRRLLEGRGSDRVLQCGFHCWTFDLDGSLRSVPEREDFPEFDMADYGLQPVRTDSWGGFVFFHLDPAAPDLSSWLSGLDVETSDYQFDDMACFARRSVVLDANWKTCLDAFQEVYHVRGVHPQLASTLQTADSSFAFFGPHSQMMNPQGVPADEGTGRLTDGALLARALRDRCIEHGIDVSGVKPSRFRGNYQFHVFPNISINTHPSGGQLFRFLPHPRDVDKMCLDVWFLERVNPGVDRPPEADSVSFDPAVSRFSETFRDFALPDHVDSFSDELVEVYTTALDQDFAMLPEVQRGLHSSAMRPILLSSQEQRIVHWNAMLDALLEGEGFDDAWRLLLAADR